MSLAPSLFLSAGDHGDGLSHGESLSPKLSSGASFPESVWEDILSGNDQEQSIVLVAQI